MFKKFCLLCVSMLAMHAGVALAQATVSATPESKMRQTLEQLVPQAKIEQIAPAPLPGFHQVIASGHLTSSHLVYISNDGRYVFNGELIDVAKRENLTDNAWAVYRKAELAKVPISDRIVFAPPKPKYTVTVFTDVTCPYCRVLHDHVKEINKEGIAVQYLAWPRSGITGEDGQPTSTYKEMVSIWCAADRNEAFDAAKQDHAPKARDCKNPVKEQFELGLRLGVTGTPAVYAQDGTLIGGYLTPRQMLEAVRQHSAKGG